MVIFIVWIVWKVSEHIPSGFSMSAISSFRSTEYKHEVYRSKDCMKRFCVFLRVYAMKKINFKKKKMELSIKQQQWSYEYAKTCYICKEKFKNKYLKDKKYRKVRHHWLHKGEHRGAAHSKCSLKHSVPKKILIAFHNGSNNDHHFIIKELAVEKKNYLLV